MTPAARLSAAIEVLDRILAGGSVEQTLTNWGRASRYAGSGDRAAVRDTVYDALRCKRSFASLGGALTGRGLVLGGLRAAGIAPAELFTGQAHAPAVVSPHEIGHPPERAAAFDLPDWLLAPMQAALGDAFATTMQAMRQRAPVYLRVNLARISREGAMASLAAEGIESELAGDVNTALQVTANERKIGTSTTYLSGLVELQDISSQAIVATLPVQPGSRVLDYCAGGGGKTLALAARGVAPFAHDINAARMKDIPLRAKRAGVEVLISDNPSESWPYDLILIDAPCSGSGSWRRDPQGKWALTPERLAEILQIQAGILDRCQALLGPEGILAYATCSFLVEENEAQIRAFLARSAGFRVTHQQRFGPLTGGDGFFLAMLTRK
jgi:16S rRNA (cytosine967-C5)-methyltransferase